LVDPIMTRLASRLTLVTLLLLAATGMVLQAGSVSHVHAASHAGVYNGEHDLTLLAGLASHVLLVDVTLVPALDSMSVLIPPYVPERPAARLARSGNSRAPPVR
jgi:hypothetical protein